MPVFRNGKFSIVAYEWDGSADLANRLFGEEYGKDWRYNGNAVEFPERFSGLPIDNCAEIGDMIAFHSNDSRKAYTKEEFFRVYKAE